SLGLRAGAVVAASIPLSLAIVFAVMDMSGIALQRVSLGALIISLGLLVDDAMITVEMMISRLELGYDKLAAATYAYTTTAFPMLTGTLVTIAGFVPVGFARSSAGEYTFSLFAVIATALLVSWFVAVLFAPVLGVLILPDRPKHAAAKAAPPSAPGAPVPEERRTRLIRGIILFCMRRRFLVIGATLLIFAGSVFAMRFVQQQFFPASDRDELMVDLNLPPNASIYAADEASRRLEALLAADPDIVRFSSYVGQGAVRFYLPLNLQLPNDFFAQTVVVTKGLAERERVRERLEQALAESFPGVVGRVYPLELGPPVGWPLQFRLSGPDPQRVRELAFGLADIVAGDGFAANVNFDWGQPARMVRLHVDQDRARQLGISSERLAGTLNTIASGMTITQVRDEIHLVDVVSRARDDERTTLDAVSSLQIPATDGRAVPISAIATPEYAVEQPIVWRRDRLPTITVQADVRGAQAKTVNTRLAPQIAAYADTLPAGYEVAVGGTEEASRRSMRSVVKVLPVMAILMLTLLMIQLHSFNRLFLVLSVAPLGLIGV
ncbi:MAG: efflux RND transporter permease subunit, partial [Microthrixaceae bacterium]